VAVGIAVRLTHRPRRDPVKGPEENMRKRTIRSGAFFLAAALCFPADRASAQAPYFQNKTIKVVRGGLRGAPVDVIRGEVTGLPIPATAEIAIEGEVPPPKEHRCTWKDPSASGPATTLTARPMGR